MIPTIAKNIAEFISTAPNEAQPLLNKMYETIRKAAPGTDETINYGIPTFKYLGRNLVHFSGYKKHIGFYPGAACITSFEKELEGYKTSKGTVQFPMDKPLPVKLIVQMVQFRLAQEKEKAAKKKK